MSDEKRPDDRDPEPHGAQVDTGDPPGPAEADPRVGTVLADRYRIDRLIDTGAMGRVYEGRHVHMQKRMALKVLHRELSAVPEFVSRFEREAMAAANIDSEHVAAATDFGKLPDGSVYLALEFVEGETLRYAIERGPMDEERALEIARQVALALRSAHSLGIVHRDLKPENVMLVERPGDKDFVKVLDFGVAKVPIGEVAEGPASKRPITKAGIVFGTPEYMAPEQALGKKVDARADLYSLGVILYEMLAGRRPFDEEGPDGSSILGQQLSSVAPTVGTRAPEVVVHPGIEQLALSLLEREPGERPQTAQAVVDEIDRLRGKPTGRAELITIQSQAPVGGEGLRSATVMAARTSIAARRATEPLREWLDARRDRLPAPLRNAPSAVLLGVPAGLLLLVLGTAIFSLSRPGDEQAPLPAATETEDAPPTAEPGPAPAAQPEYEKVGEAALEVATRKGDTELAKLAERYPRDPNVPLALVMLRLRTKDFPGAAEALRRAIELDPRVAEQGPVASAVWVLAQNKNSADIAFDLLTRSMGAKGRTILQDLVSTESVKADVRERARRALALLEE
jgi:eukaryotic-like serine/threonine-protein kinase